LYERFLENGKKVTEDVDISVDGNFVQHHVQDNDTELWVINDFNTVSSKYYYYYYYYHYYYYMIYIAPISRNESEALASLGGEHG